MSYWEKRKEHDMYEAMKSAEETSQEIAEIYARASRELNYQISKIYERYRDKYDMTDEEALRLLNAMKDPADIDELKMKLQGLEGEAAKEILKELESPAYRARIKRLENLQDEIDRKMKEVYKQEKKISTDHYIDQYQQSYYREIFDTKKMTGLDFSFSKVDPKRLEKVLHSNWSGANYSKRIWNNTEELAEDLKKEISLAYLTGKAERDIAHDIALKYATGASNARRLVRTESAYISGQAQAAADEECGIDKYRIVATLDLRTSKICQEMDGKEFAYKDMKVGENYPPFHPYCRTTIISVLDDQDLDVLQRRARDPETGKNKTFPASMTYKEWYAQEVEGKGVGQSTDNAPQEPKKPEVSEETRQQMSERRKQRAAERAAKQASVPINKQGQEIEFDLPANIADEDRRKRAIARNEKIKELITNMANEYDTNLTKVKRGAEKAAGEVDLAGVMGLSDSHPETVLHEFAHSMASTDRIKAELADDKEKEFMKELKKIRKRYEDARAKDPKISISAYSHHSLDEFYAEAFSHAKMKQLGLDKSWGYGDDYTFSDEVLELTDKYFKKSEFINKTKKSIKIAGSSGQPDEIIEKTIKSSSTIEEAEAFIKDFIDETQWMATGVSYEGVEVETANIVNKSVASWYNQFKVNKLGGIIAPAGNTKDGRAIANAAAAYHPIKNSLYLNRKSMKNVKTFMKDLEEEQKLVKEFLQNEAAFDRSKMSARAWDCLVNSKVSGRAKVAETMEDVINHELGHGLERYVYKHNNWQKAFSNMKKYAPQVSGYACDGEDEYIAESFCSYMKGEKKIDPELEKIFDDLRR